MSNSSREPIGLQRIEIVLSFAAAIDQPRHPHQRQVVADGRLAFAQPVAQRPHVQFGTLRQKIQDSQAGFIGQQFAKLDQVVDQQFGVGRRRIVCRFSAGCGSRVPAVGVRSFTVASSTVALFCSLFGLVHNRHRRFFRYSPRLLMASSRRTVAGAGSETVFTEQARSLNHREFRRLKRCAASKRIFAPRLGRKLFEYCRTDNRRCETIDLSEHLCAATRNNFDTSLVARGGATPGRLVGRIVLLFARIGNPPAKKALPSVRIARATSPTVFTVSRLAMSRARSISPNRSLPNIRIPAGLGQSPTHGDVRACRRKSRRRKPDAKNARIGRAVVDS